MSDHPTPPPPTPPPPPVVSLEDRKARLDSAVQQYARGGWRMESRGETQATVAKGKRVNHLLHLVLSLVTLGVWLIVWLIVAIVSGEKRRLLSVDDQGRLVDQKV